MVQSRAATVADYLAELPKERRDVVSAVLKVVRKNVPSGYREAMLWGMPCWAVPLETFPDTYNGQPLCYAALAAQKSFFALYLTCVYGDPANTRTLKEGFAKAGKKLDMGKSCIRFRRLEDLPLDVIGQVVASTPPEALIARHEAVHAGRKRKKTPSRRGIRPRRRASPRRARGDAPGATRGRRR